MIWFTRVVILGVFIAIGAGISPASRAQTPITLVVADAFPPTQYLSRAGVPSGLVVDVALAVLEEAGFDPVTVRALPWNRAQMMTLQGETVIGGFSYSEERVDRGFVYSDVAFHMPIVVVTRTDYDMAFQDGYDLIGHRVGIPLGASYGPVFESLRPRLTLQQDDSSAEQRLRQVLHGRIDVGIFVGGRVFLEYTQEQFGIDPSDFRMFDTPLTQDALHLAVGTANPMADQIIARINSAIATLQADGTIAAIVARDPDRDRRNDPAG